MQVASGNRLSTRQANTGLDACSWQSVQDQIYAAAFKAQTDARGSLRSTNTTQGFQIEYSQDGRTSIQALDHQAADFRVSIGLKALGYKKLHAVGQPTRVTNTDLGTTSGSKVSYQWSQYLSEWWINDQHSLEQWFYLRKAPLGRSKGELLRLSLELKTNMEVSQKKNQLILKRAGRAITYSKLRVWDAGGKELEASMHWNKSGIELRIVDSAAVYPLLIDPSFAQQAYLKASNTDAGDYFGLSVAVSGETLVVGAPGEASNAKGINGNQANNDALNAGAVYVFVRSGDTWRQQAYLKASNSGAGDRFGWSVAISGATIVVGAPLESSDAKRVNGNQTNDDAHSSGATYVFVRSKGKWHQQAYLKASNSGPGDKFGWSVAMSGRTIVVGTPSESSNAKGINSNQSNNDAEGAGAAYVFIRRGRKWKQEAYLKASNTESFDGFGTSVAISETTLVVGAPREDSYTRGVNGNQVNNDASEAGAAYVFVRKGRKWSQQAYLKASNPSELYIFGQSVAISGETIAIGSPGESSNAKGINGNQSNADALESGAAYVFVRSGSKWSQQAYLKASDTDGWGYFGEEVAIVGGIAVVGARLESSDAKGIDGDPTNNSAPAAGAAYVFVRSGGNWNQQGYLKASNTDRFDYFGTAVAISGQTIVVGASSEDSDTNGVNGDQANNAASAAGAAYVFTTTTLLTSGQKRLWINDELDNIKPLTVIGAEKDQEMSLGRAVPFKVFPNPTSGNVKVELSQSINNGKIVVENAMGRMVASQIVDQSNPFSMDLSTFPKGMYTFKVITSTGITSVQRVIVH